MNAEEAAGRLGGARKSGDGWVARCPAHDDHNPSLSLTDGDDGKLLYNCFKGCKPEEVRAALIAGGVIEERPRDEKRHAFHIAKLGNPSKTYAYKNAKGGIEFFVARYETNDGKEIRPWRPAGANWECKAPAAPRVLYRLPELLADEDRAVLVVEGEKCADAAAALLGTTYAVTTWSGGVGALAKTDLSPLHGREVVLWPDADPPGRAAMAAIHRKLSGNGAGASITLIEVSDLPEGWDVADAIAEGWGAEEAQTFIEENAKPLAAAHVEEMLAPAAPAAASSGAEREDAQSLWPPCLDLAALALEEPQRPHHIIADWLPAGEVTLFAGHGGSGKSLVALHLAACLALGKPWWGLPVEKKRVLYISAEDGQAVLAWRITRIAAHLGVAVAELAPGLGVIDAANREAELLIDPGRGDAPILTALYTALPALMAEFDVLILDGASDLFGASEIQRRPVRVFLRALRRLVREDGAVLLLAHIDKAASRDKSATDRYSGSTAWNNSVRSRWALDADDDATLRLSLAKANHARSGAEFKLRWDEQAHLYVADPAPEGGIVGAIRERQEREAILRSIKSCIDEGIVVPDAAQGRRTALNVLSPRPTFPKSMRNFRHFWPEIEKLRQEGLIKNEEYRRSNRHPAEKIVLTAEGVRRCAEFQK